VRIAGGVERVIRSQQRKARRAIDVRSRRGAIARFRLVILFVLTRVRVPQLLQKFLEDRLIHTLRPSWHSQQMMPRRARRPESRKAFRAARIALVP
jgi:hypothetical protein